MKTYNKPSILIESFELVEHITACSLGEGVQTNTRQDTDCYYVDNGRSLFNESNTVCASFYAPWDESWEEYFNKIMNDSEGVCYNTFGGIGTPFHS